MISNSFLNCWRLTLSTRLGWLRMYVVTYIAYVHSIRNWSSLLRSYVMYTLPEARWILTLSPVLITFSYRQYVVTVSFRLPWPVPIGLFHCHLSEGTHISCNWIPQNWSIFCVQLGDKLFFFALRIWSDRTCRYVLWLLSGYVVMWLVALITHN